MPSAKIPIMQDTFTGSGSLQAHTPDSGGTWVKDSAQQDLIISTAIGKQNQLTCAVVLGQANTIVYHILANPSGNYYQYASFTLANKSTVIEFFSLAIRKDSATQAQVGCHYDWPNGVITIAEVDASGNGGLSTSVTGVTFANSDFLEFRVTDLGVAQVFQNNNLLLSGNLQKPAVVGDCYGISWVSPVFVPPGQTPTTLDTMDFGVITGVTPPPVVVHYHPLPTFRPDF